MDKETRSKLRYIVTQCRTILERAIGEILQGQFGIHHTGLVEEAESMTHLSADDREYREQTIVHLEHIKAAGFKTGDAVQQLIRETSFTHLNRLCAYKMMEVRDLIRTAVSKGIKSQGFMFYMADHPADENHWKGGQQELAYRHFLLWLGGTFANEIPALFSPHDPANRLFPAQRVLDQVLELINGDELKNIWEQDETIGWIYQYFTPKELRDQARKESAVPRNSYELAFRNQFYTPRYVVQFLTDNTLGRIWYEMCQGTTRLKDLCRYLVCRTNEVFLGDGETIPSQPDSAEPPAEKQGSQPACISYRKIKDPREIRMLDPACGSMHFGLYSFDLFEAIYEEAWDNHPGLMLDLRAAVKDKTEFMKAVPGMILQHNIHGIDIDLRATQISALALWLRAQRSFQRLGLKREDRPKITKSNVVCAEPMPGETKLLEDFVAELQPKALGEMVQQVFNKMALAGEAGSLLKIEEEISRIVAETKKRAIEEQEKATDRKGNVELFTTAEVKRLKGDQQERLDFSDITDEQFWDNAERRVIESLRNYAERAANGRGFLRRLFAEDAERGFAFLEICRKRFDVVLMNPPFGSPTPKIQHLLDPRAAGNIYPAFVLNGCRICTGFVGAITDRTFLVQASFEDFREALLTNESSLVLTADLGWGVLDTADVQVAAYVIRVGQQPVHYFADLRDKEEQSEHLASLVKRLDHWVALTSEYIRRLPNEVFAYTLPSVYMSVIGRSTPLSELASLPRGLGSNDAERTYKAWYEVPVGSIGPNKRYRSLSNGGSFSPFFRDDAGIADWQRLDGKLLVTEGYKDGFKAYDQKRYDEYFLSGLSFPKQSTVFNVAALPEDAIPTREGKAIIPHNRADLLLLLGYLNSSFVRFFIDGTTGLHKQSGPIGMIPVPEFSVDVKERLSKCAHEYYLILSRSFHEDETSRLFVAPRIDTAATREMPSIGNIDEIVFAALGVQTADQESIRREVPPFPLYSPTTHDIISYCIGVAIGRWDIRFATGQKVAPWSADPFGPLPNLPFGMLTEQPQNYPLTIDGDGILLDELDHKDDIVRRVREVLALICKERADTTEQEACTVLGVEELRDYFRKPGNGGFWIDHVNRYFKSRRRAPIYWLLQSARKSFALWIYYHRLERDTLNKALVNYVEPKLRLENNRLQELRGKVTEVGTTGSAARDLERKIERQEELISELNDFQDKLRRVADLHLEPDLNDGVVLNIAPLWELVPWKEAKKHWEELLEGEYEWSSIAKQLKAKGLVKR
jgi:hypothetical protein